MPDDYEKYSKMAEWVATHSSDVTPEYIGQMLSEATATIDSYLQGDERAHELAKRGNARSWLEERARRSGYQLAALTPGIYESEYGNTISWDGQVAYDLDMGEEVELGIILKDKFIRPLD